MRFFLLLNFVLLSEGMFGRVLINEVMQSNVTGIMDNLNDFPDSWVELYNDDSTATTLQNYRIGLSSIPADCYVLTCSDTLNSKGYSLIYCDKEGDTTLATTAHHTNFELATDENSTLYLFTPEGELCDSLNLPEMLAPDIAYGRKTDGSDTLGHFRTATPGRTNGGIMSERLLKKPDFNIEGGFFTDPIVLKITAKEKDSIAQVRYTTDGSEPTENSPLFPDSMIIEKSTAVRAKTFCDTALSRPSQTESYLFAGRDLTLPIFSITLDTAYLYNEDIGIYCKGDTAKNALRDCQPKFTGYPLNNYVYEWRRPMNVEYYENGNMGATFNQVGEMKVGGNSSRMMDYKSFVLYSDERFGEKKFKANFWTNKTDISKQKQILLRQSGQEYPFTFLRDAYGQMLFGKEVNLDWSDYQPSIIYVNGEYWGMLNNRERTNDYYVKTNYPEVEDYDCLDVYGVVYTGDNYDFWHSYNIVTGDSATTYLQVDSVLDIDEYLNYYLMNIYLSNNDWPGNNNLCWKEKGGKGKWRYIAKDVDLSCGFHCGKSNDDGDMIEWSLGQCTEKPWIEFAYQVNRKLMSLPEFRNQFTDRAAIYMGTFLRSENTTHLLDSLAGNIATEMTYFRPKIEAWDKWETNLDSMRNWLKQRTEFMYSYIDSFFNLNGVAAVDIETSDGDSLYFNNIKLKKQTFNGKYYKGKTIFLTHKKDAVKYEGEETLLTDTTPREEERGWKVTCVDTNQTYRTDTIMSENLSYEVPQNAAHIYITDLNGSCSIENIYQNLVEKSEGYDEYMISDLSGRTQKVKTLQELQSLLKEHKVYIVNALKDGKIEETLKIMAK